MDDLLLTIIVPIYKVEKYLVRCVDSLINQSYRRLEILLVDDGSPDKSGDICDQYAKKDHRITVIHKENGGLSDARNSGLDIANGDYIMFVDADDWLDIRACETLVNIITENKSDVVVFGLKYVYDSGKEINTQKGITGLADKKECIKRLIYNVTIGGIFNYACNKIFSKSLFEDLRFPLGFLAEDQGVMYKLIHKSHRIYVTDMPLYNYYQRVDSISSSQYSPRLIKDRHELWLGRLEFLKKEYPDLLNFQIAQMLGTTYVSIVKLEGKKEFESLRESLLRFSNQYSMNLGDFIKLDRRIRLHFYCYPLFWLYVKLFIK